MTAYYTKNDLKIYHVCKNCYVANNIEREDLAEGVPPSARLCKVCEELQRQRACTPGTPTPAS